MIEKKDLDNEDPRWLICKVLKALKRSGRQQEVNEFLDKTHNCQNYNEILLLSKEYIEFE